MYVTAIPIPKIPNEKNPGTKLRTDAPQDDAMYNAFLSAAHPDCTMFAQVTPVALVVVVAVVTFVATVPIKLVPTIMAIKPPIRFAIMVFWTLFKQYQLV